MVYRMSKSVDAPRSFSFADSMLGFLVEKSEVDNGIWLPSLEV